MTYGSSGLKNSLLSLCASKSIKKYFKKCSPSTVDVCSFSLPLGLHISATIDRIKMVPISFLISFLRSLQGLAPFCQSTQVIFSNFYPLSEMPFLNCSDNGIRRKLEHFQNAPKGNIDVYGTRFIGTKFHAFTTFSAIFTRICFTIFIAEKLNIRVVLIRFVLFHLI